jgi:hypothetical protein
VSASTVKLLTAALEIAGGRRALAERLGVEETVLNKFLTDSFPLPDALLLKAVDIILEDRQRRPIPGQSRAALPASPEDGT